MFLHFLTMPSDEFHAPDEHVSCTMSTDDPAMEALGKRGLDDYMLLCKLRRLDFRKDLLPEYWPAGRRVSVTSPMRS